MNPTARMFLIIGGINAALVVVLGAFGAHGLKAKITAEMMTVFQTGVHYHLFHAMGLLAVGLTATWLGDSTVLKWSGWLMLVGILLFSGSLYLLVVTGPRWLGMITPFGGMAFIVAWILFVAAVVRSP